MEIHLFAKILNTLPEFSRDADTPLENSGRVFNIANTKARKFIKSEKIGPSISETKNQWLLRLGQMKISASKNPQMKKKKKIEYFHTYALLPKHGRAMDLSSLPKEKSSNCTSPSFSVFSHGKKQYLQLD